MQLNTTESLSSKHHRILIITALCLTMAFIDFILFVYLADLLAVVFFGPQSDVWLQYLQTFLLLAVGYLARPLGGLLFGKYGDTYGRKPAFMLSMLGTMIFTFIIALLPTYQHIGIIAPMLLIIARIGQGIAIGGALPSAWTFVVEHLPVKNIGLGCGIICAIGALSYLAVVSAISFLQDTLTPSQILNHGWRILFIFSGGLGLISSYLLKHLSETPIFDNMTNSSTHLDSYVDIVSLEEQHNPTPAYTPPAQVSFRPIGLLNIVQSVIKHHTFAFIVSFIISLIIASLSMYMPILMTPILAENHLLSYEYLYFGSVIGLIFLAFGSVLFGYLTDRFGAGQVLAFGGMFLILQVAVFFHYLQNGGELILICFALLGLSNGLIGTLPSVMTRLFPAKVRMTGIGISYNIAHTMIGGILPFLLGYASFYFSLVPALYLAMVGVMAIFLSFFVYYMPRSKRDLNR
ncbi:MFS transporter [Moraxella sp. Tifton1]|uniref:MFS transporter n=1 Tax=Moraxella oculi TaxID=2940516 RepID=UPI002012E115|nr:MFS transporter [Moraxella sp. Tifton1]MCL1622857.1 MFS transporter [Moraxella sp. Tifton1]